MNDSEIAKDQLLRQKTREKAVPAAFVTTAIFSILTVFWLAADRHIPACDEANHVLNGLTYANLLEHIRPWRLSWWHSFFSVNTYYPPIGTLAMGLALASSSVKDLSALVTLKLTWLCILSLSVALITFKISRNTIAVIVAIFLVNCCPLTCELSHSALLDLPLVAMVALGLAALYWKDGGSLPWRSLVTGIIIGLAIMTKQVAIAFLGFPVLLDTVRTLKANRNKKGALSLALVLVPILIICLPWTILNFGSVQKLNGEIATDLATRGTAASRILYNFKYYLGSWIYSASPLILIVSLCGIGGLTKAQHKKFASLWLAILPAACALTMISCQPARDRYVAPLVILVAVFGGCSLASLRWKHKIAFAIIALVGLPLIALQYLSYNFCPYPIDQPSLTGLTSLLGCTSREHISPFFDANSVVYNQHSPPVASGGSIADQILDCVEETDGKLCSYMNITAFAGGLDVHEMELLAQLKGIGIRPSTSRLWTALGDKEEFSQSKAQYYRWYVIKDGDQGFRFADKADQIAHNQLLDYVKKHYLLAKTLTGLDGSRVEVYRSHITFNH